MLLKDARIGSLESKPRDNSIWGIRRQSGKATLVRIPPPYAERFRAAVTWVSQVRVLELSTPFGALISIRRLDEP